ncbi:Ca(2+)-dependent cysteine protease [Spiromyces aspiralis]|uniref:Ca(2+)-dependent cysteine protease n=1 Tax=Spiromyces aspiralis TaxID=68401 RepID=A0ACC1HTE0_9FUNG|nr:Ca(2+)-dependent cysteine protease [Spiromyces aspiralis]
MLPPGTQSSDILYGCDNGESSESRGTRATDAWLPTPPLSATLPSRAPVATASNEGHNWYCSGGTGALRPAGKENDNHHGMVDPQPTSMLTPEQKILLRKWHWHRQRQAMLKECKPRPRSTTTTTTSGDFGTREYYQNYYHHQPSMYYPTAAAAPPAAGPDGYYYNQNHNNQQQYYDLPSSYYFPAYYGNYAVPYLQQQLFEPAVASAMPSKLNCPKQGAIQKPQDSSSTITTPVSENDEDTSKQQAIAQQPPHTPGLEVQTPSYSNNYISTVKRQYDEYGRMLPIKRALLIGINYQQTQNVLNGCVNDVHHIKRFLIEHFEFRPEDIVILTDDQVENPKRLPTRENILRGMRWLVHGSMENDSFFIHYSGHGVLKKLGPDEHPYHPSQGKNKKKNKGGFLSNFLTHGEKVPAICPMDFDKCTLKNVIDSYTIHKLLVADLHSKAYLTSVFDCCHSASMMALPYRFNTKGKQKNKTDIEIAGKTLLVGLEYYLLNDLAETIDCIQDAFLTLYRGDSQLKETQVRMSSCANIVMFSGCKDYEKSHDTKLIEGDVVYGAMTKAFVESMNEKPGQSYLELLVDIRRRLQKKGYPQTPQISCSKSDFSVKNTFVM